MYVLTSPDYLSTRHQPVNLCQITPIITILPENPPKEYNFQIKHQRSFSPLSNYRGVTVNQLAVQLALCDTAGHLNQGYDWLAQPTDLQGRRVDMMVKIVHASKIVWLADDESRGVMARFRFYTDPQFRESKAVHGKQTPAFRYAKQFTLSKFGLCWRHCDSRLPALRLIVIR
jgi:hypothetical protein